MNLGRSIQNAKDNASKFIQKKWDEHKAEQRREDSRKLLEKEAFTKAYESERIKLKRIEGRIKAESEIFPTKREKDSDKGANTESSVKAPSDKSPLYVGHPVTKPDTAIRIQNYIERT